MAAAKADLLVVSALDDIAWLLNARGEDISYNPVFFAYVLITHDSIVLCIDNAKVTPELRSHLNLDDPSLNNACRVELAAYTEAESLLRKAVADTIKHVWISPLSNKALFNCIPKDRLLKSYSPIPAFKSVKNAVELDGMRKCHVRDGAALCEFLHWLEREVVKRSVSEIEASDYAEMCRSKQDLYVSLSFGTISSSGSNAAIIHYSATAESNRTIAPHEVYLIDSGAQYRDGTTDVTRTVHFGEPSDFEKECFTRVLQGNIRLETAVFPHGCKGLFLDCLARQPLWTAGLDYRHGTSHGVGSFLNVHEGPCGIAQRVRLEDIALDKAMVLSNEPGFYKDGEFGVRIENLCEVVDKQTQYNFQDTGFLTFKTLTLLPIQTKMICKEMLSAAEIKWINDYHSRVRQEVGEELRKSGSSETLEWLVKQTESI